MASEEQPHVKVTMDRIYEKLLEVDAKVQALELRSTVEAVDKLNDRVTKLERWQAVVYAVAGLLATGITIGLNAWLK